MPRPVPMETLLVLDSPLGWRWSVEVGRAGLVVRMVGMKRNPGTSGSVMLGPSSQPRASRLSTAWHQVVPRKGELGPRNTGNWRGVCPSEPLGEWNLWLGVGEGRGSRHQLGSCVYLPLFLSKCSLGARKAENACCFKRAAWV